MRKISGRIALRAFIAVALARADPLERGLRGVPGVFGERSPRSRATSW